MYNEVLEELVVVKRSGQRVSFNASKVAIAIKSAFDSVGNSDDKKIFKIFEKVLNFINDNYRERKTINVEDIQDIVENTLYNEKCYDVYNSFKEYRQKRALSRKVFAEKQQHKFVKAIEKIEETTLNRKGNKTADDIIYDFGRIISNEYTKSYVLDTKSVRAAEEGNIYIHDLDYFSLGIFPSMHLKLSNEIVDEYDVDKLINKIIDVEKEVYKEIGINNVDYLFESYIMLRFKDIFKKSLFKYLRVSGFYELVNLKRIEELINLERNINFSFESYESVIPNQKVGELFEYAKSDAIEMVNNICERVIYKILVNLENRAERKTTYTLSFGLNNSEIGKLLNQKLLSILSQSKYSKLNIIIKLTSLDMEMIAKIAKLLETNSSVNVQFVDEDVDIEYFSDGVKVYQNTNDDQNASSGRMVVASSSINFARLGLKFRGKPIDDFYLELGNAVELVKNELLLSFETIGSKCKEYYKSLFNGNTYDDEKLEVGQKIRKVIKNGVLNIGVIGLNECSVLLESDPLKRKKLIENILLFLNRKCEAYTQETKLNFGVYEPIDSHSRKKLLEIDKAIYGIVTDVTDKVKYDLLDSSVVDDYNELAKIQQLFSSGKLITINTGKLSIKKLADILEKLKSNKVEFARLVVGRNEY